MQLKQRGGRRTGCAGTLLLVVVAVAPAARAEEFCGSVAGRVSDRALGSPIRAVRVTLRAERDAPVATASPWTPGCLGAGEGRRPGGSRAAITDGSGEYRFAGVTAGRYVLSFIDGSHGARALRGIVVEPGSDLRVDSELEPVLADRVTVSGRKDEDDSGLSRRVLGRDALDRAPAALGDPFRALVGQAGIAPESDFKSEMRVRGGDATETTVLLDGMPLPYSYHFGGGPGSAGALNGDLVDEVAVATGGFSVEHGDALAGLIDLSTRDPQAERLTGTAGIGTVLAHAALFGPAGDGSWILSGRMSDLGLYDDRVSGEAADGVAFHDLFGALRMPLAGGARLAVALLGTGDDYRADLGQTDRAEMAGASRGIRGRLDLPLDPGMLLRVQAADADLSVVSGVTGGQRFDQMQRRQDLRVSLLRVRGTAHRLHGGVGLERIAGGMSGSVSDGSSLRTSDLDYDAFRASLFVEDTWQPADVVRLRYGARADRSSWTGQGAVSPRFSLEVDPARGITLRCAAGRFVQFPRQEQAFLAAGETLRMQAADHFIAGMEVSLPGRSRLIVEAYRKDLEDPIGEAVNRYVELPELVTRFDAARSRGAEVTLERRAVDAWTWQVHYGYLEATQTKDGVTTPRNSDQRHSVEMSCGRRFGRGWEAGGTFRSASGLPYTPLEPWTNGIDYGEVLGDLNGARLPGYRRLDLSLARSLPVSWGRLDVRLDLINVLNRANVRSVDLSFDPSSAGFYETTSYQSPFLPVFSLSAEF